MQIFDWASGKTFGEVMLTGKSYVKNRKHRYVEVICNCNTIKWIRFDGLKSGAVSSCGCFHVESARKQFTTHGLSNHALYTVHEDMKARCLNPNSESYGDYGGRGIKIFEFWVNDFKEFYNWAINNGWSEGCGLTLDRINNDGDYHPNNCRFSTDHVQSRNKRSNVVITLFNETKCMKDWALDSRCMVEYKTLQTRIKRGWNNEEAIITPSKIPQNKRVRLT